MSPARRARNPWLGRGDKPVRKLIQAPTDVIVVSAYLGYLPRNSPKVHTIGNVWEGIPDVDVHIGAVALKALVFQTLQDSWHRWSSGFPLDAHDLSLRIKKTYVRIEPRPGVPDRDFISDGFFKTSGKPPSLKFKPGTLDIVLVMHESLFEKVVDYKVNIESSQSTEQTQSQLAHNYPLPQEVSAQNYLVSSFSSQQPNSPDLQRQGHQPERDINTVSDVKWSNVRITRRPDHTTGIHDSQSDVEWEQVLDGSPATPPRDIPSKHARVSQDPVTPKSKRLKATFVSPLAADIDRALQNQGPASSKQVETLLKNKFYFITVHVLKKRSFMELLADPVLSYTTPKPAFGTLEVNISQTIGIIKGTFKTAHWGRITPGSTRSPLTHPLAFPWKEPVCIKQPYHTKPKTAGQRAKTFRLDSGKEMKVLLQELRCQAWGEGLMLLVYDFIERELAARGPAPFHIPPMRFVDSALVVLQDADAHVLLAEELITQEHEGGFRRYLDNAHATPFEDLGVEDLYRAHFLCFAQHVQWEKTQGQAFVSDFQGGTTLLTDPQIMTHPDLGVDLFSDGNIPGGFHDFPQQHECNQMCTFFQLAWPVLVQRDKTSIASTSSVPCE